MSNSDTLGEGITTLLVDMIVNGEIKREKDGSPIIGEDGNPIRIQASAAMVTAAINWKKYLDHNSNGDGDPIGDAIIRAQAAAAGQRHPLLDLDLETDDMATQT